MRVIDFHVHCGSFPQWDLHLPVDKWLETMERDGICASIIFSDLHSADIDPRRNAAILEAGKQNPCLFPFHWVNVQADFSQKCLQNQIGFIEQHLDLIQGLKFHPSISQVAVNDPRLQPLWDYWSRKRDGNRLVTIHSGRSSISNGQYLMEVARTYPSVNWIIAHLGGGVFDRIMECLYYYSQHGIPDNVFFDVSQTTHSILLKRAVDILGDQHLLYGSDEPFLDSRLVRNTIEYSGISTKSAERILYANAACLLGDEINRIGNAPLQSPKCGTYK